VKRENDPGFWIRTALWITSIVIVAVPLKSLKESHGSLIYMIAGVSVIFFLFLCGIAISHWLNNRYKA